MFQLKFVPLKKIYKKVFLSFFAKSQYFGRKLQLKVLGGRYALFDLNFRPWFNVNPALSPVSDSGYIGFQSI